jgi:hypothetical protein
MRHHQRCRSLAAYHLKGGKTTLRAHHALVAETEFVCPGQNRRGDHAKAEMASAKLLGEEPEERHSVRRNLLL